MSSAVQSKDTVVVVDDKDAVDEQDYNYFYTEVHYPKSGKTIRRYMSVGVDDGVTRYVSGKIALKHDPQPHRKLATKDKTIREFKKKHYTDADVVGYRQIMVNSRHSSDRPMTQAVLKDGSLISVKAEVATESGKPIKNREDADWSWFIAASLRSADDPAVRQHQKQLRAQYKKSKTQIRLRAEQTIIDEKRHNRKERQLEKLRLQKLREFETSRTRGMDGNEDDEKLQTKHNPNLKSKSKSKSNSKYKLVVDDDDKPGSKPRHSRLAITYKK